MFTATLHSVSRGKILVKLEGTHVPAGVAPVPPAQNALRIAPSVKREMVDKCVHGRDTPTSAVNQLQGEMKRAKKGGSGSASPSMFNSRFNPRVSVVRSAVGAERSDGRGGREDASLGDWARSNLFVTSQAMPRGLVLYYDPLSATSGLVVFATEESLLLAREYGQTIGSTDCKHDTVRDCRSMYSSYRVRTPWGWFLVSVWIGPNEVVITIELALKAIACNVPCSDPNCSHPVTERWENGIYKRWRACAPCFKPWVATDKHMPTYTAIEAAGFAGSVLDAFHGFRAYDEKLLSLQIRDSPAVAAAGAFRLWTRSESYAKVMPTRTHPSGWRDTHPNHTP